MGISQAEIENMRTRAREAGFGVDDAQADALRATIADTADAQAGDMERIIVEGQEVMIEANASEGERRNTQARLDSDVQDAAREAERSGTRVGRIETTGLGSREKDAAKAQARNRADEDARMQKLLALQAALDAMDAEIARLDGEIGALDQLLGIIDSGEKLDPNDPAHRATLERSGIPKEKWNDITREDIEAAKREREAERNGIKENRAEAQQDMSAMKGKSYEDQLEIAEDVVDEHGATTAHAAALKRLDEPERKIVNTEVDKMVIGGNAARQSDTDNKVSALKDDNLDDLFGNAPPAKGHFQNASKPDVEGAPETSYEVQQTANLNLPTPGAG